MCWLGCLLSVSIIHLSVQVQPFKNSRHQRIRKKAKPGLTCPSSAFHNSVSLPSHLISLNFRFLVCKMKINHYAHLPIMIMNSGENQIKQCVLSFFAVLKLWFWNQLNLVYLPSELNEILALVSFL
jgi:hypothetical protein